MADFTPPPNCASLPHPTDMSVMQAGQRIFAAIKPVMAVETRTLKAALDCVLHQTVISPIHVPPFDNAAMDGYAIKGACLNHDRVVLQQVGTAFAGRPYTGRVADNECVRIMTGAVLPDDCDTVIMQEHVEIKDEKVIIHGAHKMGQNVRYAGEDIKMGSNVLLTGHRLCPADLGLLASLGIDKVMVRRPVRVAFLSTGDELQSISAPLVKGKIYDSNRYTLYGMLMRAHVEVIDLGVVPDQKEALKEALISASEQADVVITTGGVSVGEADYVKAVLAECGQVDFWHIAMKPGRPFAFGKIKQAAFFGLPGNPVSVMVTFYQFVLPALRQIGGEQITPIHTLTANCVSKIYKKPGRFEYQRGILFKDKAGNMHVKTTGEQGSGILRSMSMANCFILLDEACRDIAPGTSVTVQPFCGLD